MNSANRERPSSRRSINCTQEWERRAGVGDGIVRPSRSPPSAPRVSPSHGSCVQAEALTTTPAPAASWTPRCGTSPTSSSSTGSWLSNAAADQRRTGWQRRTAPWRAWSSLRARTTPSWRCLGATANPLCAAATRVSSARSASWQPPNGRSGTSSTVWGRNRSARSATRLRSATPTCGRRASRGRRGRRRRGGLSRTLDPRVSQAHADAGTDIPPMAIGTPPRTGRRVRAHGPPTPESRGPRGRFSVTLLRPAPSMADTELPGAVTPCHWWRGRGRFAGPDRGPGHCVRYQSGCLCRRPLSQETTPVEREGCVHPPPQRGGGPLWTSPAAAQDAAGNGTDDDHADADADGADRLLRALNTALARV
mmetsp:Transcript_37493/g.87424  ORF Transcript_37493/g.87424 Transcript_37493/m.87424 type:complete len:365 (-) Transcript_37493:497-1591(-)